MTNLLAVETLVKDDSDRPDVNLGTNLWRSLPNDKAFWRKIPICSCSLTCQVHAMIRRIVVVVHDLTQAEVCDFNLSCTTSIPEEYVSCSLIGDDNEG